MTAVTPRAGIRVRGAVVLPQKPGCGAVPRQTSRCADRWLRCKITRWPTQPWKACGEFEEFQLRPARLSGLSCAASRREGVQADVLEFRQRPRVVRAGFLAFRSF